MLTHRSLILGSVLCVLVNLLPSSAAAQFEDDSSIQYFNFNRQVIVENQGGLSVSLFGPIQEVVARHLNSQGEDSSGALTINHIELSQGVSAKLPSGGDVRMLSISWGSSTIPYDEELGQRLWELARSEMEAGLRKMQRQAATAAAQRREREDQAHQQNYDNYRDELRRLQNELVAQINAKDLLGTPEDAVEQYVDAVKQLRELELERAGLEARREAIERRIDELREMARERAEDDPVLDELRRIVAIREQQLERIRSLFENATASSNEVDEQVSALAEARIELLRAERDLVENSSGAVLQELNAELSRLIIDDADLMRRIELLSELVSQLAQRAEPDSWVEIGGLKDRIEVVRRRLTEAEDALTDFRNQPQSEEFEAITIRPLEEALFGDDADESDDEEDDVREGVDR